MAKKSYTVSITIIGRKCETPLEAVNEMVMILNDEARYLTYDVVDEDTHEKFTVDLNEEEGDETLPNNALDNFIESADMPQN
jgi:hypothetical protein